MDVDHESQSSSHTWQNAADEQLLNECCMTDSTHALQQEHDVSNLENQNMPPNNTPRQPVILLDIDGAVDLDDAQPQHIIDWLANSPDKDLAAGKTLRFRGMCLMLIGGLYPRAELRVHRLGYPAESDFMIKGTTLYKMRSALDMEAIYRITMIECDAGDEHGFVWSQNNAGQGYNADEYCNLLELGADQLGRLMMFSVCREGIQHWSLIRQIPGKVYTFQECVDLLGVPEWCRAELQGFGNKAWTNGELPPKLWICKDLSLTNVTNKIRNIMEQ